MLLLFESVFVQRSCINLRHFSEEESIVIVSTLLSSYRLSSYFSIINERTSTFFFLKTYYSWLELVVGIICSFHLLPVLEMLNAAK